MRSSLMSGLSLRLAKTSVEGGAPSFFADKTGDTVCDDCLFFFIVSVLVVLSRGFIIGFKEVLRKKVLQKILSSVCLRRQKTKTIWDFVKKHFTSLFCRFKKSEQQQQQQREMTREMTSTTNT